MSAWALLFSLFLLYLFVITKSCIKYYRGHCIDATMNAVGNAATWIKSLLTDCITKLQSLRLTLHRVNMQSDSLHATSHKVSQMLFGLFVLPRAGQLTERINFNRNSYCFAYIHTIYRDVQRLFAFFFFWWLPSKVFMVSHFGDVLDIPKAKDLSSCFWLGT